MTTFYIVFDETVHNSKNNVMEIYGISALDAVQAFYEIQKELGHPSCWFKIKKITNTCDKEKEVV